MAAAAPQRATAEAAAALRALPRGRPLYRGGATRRTSSAGGGGPAPRDPRVARGGLSAMPCRGGGTFPPPPAGPGRGAGPGLGLRRRHQGLTTTPSGAEGRPAGRVGGAAAQACGGTGREAPAAARAGQLRPRESRKMAAGGRVALRSASGPGSRRRPLRADGGAAVGGPGSGRRPVRSREGGRGGTGDGGGHGGTCRLLGVFFMARFQSLRNWRPYLFRNTGGC